MSLPRRRERAVATSASRSSTLRGCAPTASTVLGKNLLDRQILDPCLNKANIILALQKQHHKASKRPISISKNNKTNNESWIPASEKRWHGPTAPKSPTSALRPIYILRFWISEGSFLRGIILMAVGKFPESLSQGILAGRF